MENVFSEKGSFGLAYSSPMQTTHGSARLTLPTSQNLQTGAIGFESTDLSFRNGDQEKVLEAYYRFAISAESDIFAHAYYTRNPLSEPGADMDRALYVGWKHRF